MEHPPTFPPPSPDAATSCAHRPVRALLAEDDPELRAVLCAVLRQDGYEVLEADDGTQLEALIQAARCGEHGEHAVDLVISDVRMPGKDVLEVLRDLRRSDWLVPMVLITAFGSPQLHMEARRLEVHGLLDKPFSVARLRQLVLRAAPPADPDCQQEEIMKNATAFSSRPDAGDRADDLSQERRPRVLLAEDDPDLRAVLALALRQDGCEVLQARDGHHLRARLGALVYDGGRAEPVDLVITDLRMPGPDGLTTLEWLRERDWTIPVIVITAFGDPEVHAEALRLGALAVLNKPFEVDELRALVRLNAAEG